VRTKRNVREGDGTVVFSLDPILAGGSALTFEYAGQVKKPRIHIHKSATEYSDEAFSQEVGRLRDFIESHQVAVLNVAGPREFSPECMPSLSECFDNIGRSLRARIVENQELEFGPRYMIQDIEQIKVLNAQWSTN
jgi:hypothetical protein